MKKLFFDARNFEHPIPLERAIATLRELDETNYFYMLHRKNPIPLVAMAQKQNLALHTYQESEDLWHILIATDKTIDLEQLIELSEG